MKKHKLLLLLAALPALWGCASFNSGDMLVERSAARAMLDDKELVPFSEIEISWRNYPYRAPADSIGEGSVSRPKKIKPVPIDPEQGAAFARKAREIFSKAGLYDRESGRGKLRLELTSFGRWTYSDLFRSFLVDTGFIFIIPASLRVNYYLTADFAVSSGTVRVETEARNKTTFHLLMAPLYPFFSPGVKESGLLKQMLWRSATDVYTRLKAAGSPPGQLPPKPAAPTDDMQPLSGPPVEPDRTWLPGETREGIPSGDAPPILPQKPDQSWTVPTPQPAAAPPANQAPVQNSSPPDAAPAQEVPLDD